jgi:hypothetical protein
LMSLKVIYFLKVFLGLSKDLGPKRDLNTWRKAESKEIKDFVKLEMEVYIVRNMKVISWNNELKSKGYLNITHFTWKIHMLNIF